MTKKRSKVTRTARADTAAQRAATVRAEQTAKERRRRNLVVGAVALVALLAIGGIAFAVQQSRDTTGQSASAPSNAVDTYAFATGESTAPVEVRIYEDFMCPFCGQFELATRDLLQEYVDQGDVTVKYHVISILGDHSTRAANALAVVLDKAGPDVAKEFHDLLYDNQPEEGSDGLSDEDLVDLAVEVGATESEVSEGIEALKFEKWVVNASDQASKDGFDRTPSVTVDDERVEGDTVEVMIANLDAAIQAQIAN